MQTYTFLKVFFVFFVLLMFLYVLTFLYFDVLQSVLHQRASAKSTLEPLAVGAGGEGRWAMGSAA